MGKKAGLAESNRCPKNSRTETIKKDSVIINGNNQTKSKCEANKTINGSASDEDPQVLVVTSSAETQNLSDGESSEEGDRINERSSSDEDEEEVLKQKINNYQRKGKKEEVIIKGKKKSKKEEVAEVEEKIENAIYKFPMNRVSRIIRSENSDARISQEAVFVINRASEKFLELFSREAYACAFLDRKSFIAYHHLSSVVSKRKRFNFVSDFIPEKVKAEDALAQIPETEK